jgi:hypothetical protein
MIEQRYFGKLCPFYKSCPTYQGKIKLERISTLLIRNVFCNRGYMGWKNCERFKIANEGMEIPETATPYKIN